MSGRESGRAARVAQAQALRAEGLKLREIGERMGVSLKTVNTWLCDPDLARQRARREGYRGRCVDCGAPTDGSGGRGRVRLRCARCQVTNRLVPARKASARQVRALVETLWAEGKTAREIGERLGWSVKQPSAHIATLRARGFHLPHRRTPEQIARMTRDSAEHLARARTMIPRAQTPPPNTAPLRGPSPKPQPPTPSSRLGCPHPHPRS